MITIYTLPVCPNCEDLKEQLHNHNVEFNVLDLEDEDVRMDLLLECVTLVEAPIVKIGNDYMNAESALKELGIW